MKNHHAIRRSLGKTSAFALFSFFGVFSLGLVDCGGGASCDAVCSNVLDKCDQSGGLFDSVDSERNACLESCAQREQTVPDSCASERDLVLSCLSDAPSINCTDPQSSAACSMQNAALAACADHNVVVGRGTSSVDATVGTGGGGESCMEDKSCASGLCNTKLDQCGSPGGLTTPCYRDEECSGDLCNTKSDQCAVAGAIASACYRDEECANALCNTKTDQCATAAVLGGPCYRDEECANGLCNTKLDQCESPGAAGGPCYRASECQSGACNGQSCS